MQIFGISVDSFEDNKAFAKSMCLSYPLLSDTDNNIVDAYGVLNDNGTFALRSYFLIGMDGKLKWLAVNQGIIPNETVIEALNNALGN